MLDNLWENNIWVREESNHKIENESKIIQNRITEIIEVPDENEIEIEIIKKLNEQIIWQQEAKKELASTIVSELISFRRFSQKPIWCLFFSWPTWVWKTQIVKSLAEILLWDKNYFTKINCETLSESFANSTLFWSPIWYIWSDKKSVLDQENITSFYKKAIKNNSINPIIRGLNDFSILLFDEIEKAHRDVLQSLLSLLSEGKITFKNWKEAVFKNILIIFTSNIWQEEAKKSKIWFWQINDDESSSKERESIINKQMKEKFSPEFLWRITKVINFEHLTEQDCKEIIQNEIKLLNKDLKEYFRKNDIHFEMEDEVFDFLIDTWYSKEKWARELLVNFKKLVENKLAFIIESKKYEINFKKDIKIILRLKDKKLKFFMEYLEQDNEEKNQEIDYFIQESINTLESENKWLNLEEFLNIADEIDYLFQLLDMLDENSITWNNERQFTKDEIQELINSSISNLKAIWFSSKEIEKIREIYFAQNDKINLLTKILRNREIFSINKLEIFGNVSEKFIYKHIRKILIRDLNWTNFKDYEVDSIMELILWDIFEEIGKVLRVDELTDKQKTKISEFTKRIIEEAR